MPVRRSRRTLRLENEMTALSVAHVNSARSNHRRGCNKLLGRICPSPQLGSCEGACCLRRSLLAPAPPVPPPSHPAARPRTPPCPRSLARHCSSKAKRAANGSWLGCSAGTEKKQTRSWGAESRRGCTAGQGMLRFGNIIDLLGLPRLFAVKMFRPVITLASLKYPSLI